MLRPPFFDPENSNLQARVFFLLLRVDNNIRAVQQGFIFVILSTWEYALRNGSPG